MDSTSVLRTQIMYLLAEYGFLTPHQVAKLTGCHIKSAYRAISVLEELGICGAVKLGSTRQMFGTHKTNHLTVRGANIVADDQSTPIEKVRHPKANEVFIKTNFFHTNYTVDMMMSMDKWLSSNSIGLIFRDVYFDKVGSQRNGGTLRGKTRVESVDKQLIIDPDIIFAYQDDKERMFLLEVANGVDTLRFTNQIRNYLLGIYGKHIVYKYRNSGNPFNIYPRLLVAFEFANAMKSVINRLLKRQYADSFERLDEFIFFGVQSEIKEDWANSWVNLHGEKVNLFQKATLE